MKKLILNKEIISNITNDEMKKIKGGVFDEVELEFWGSRVACNTNYDPGGGCSKSKSCAATKPVCIPI